ncbi:MAG TPA: XrtA system polysaccharide chain length determinant [Rhizomicrobium sp.]|nr:XrtA system polysaccharide chain length determinant [Rhizomicrobium sp.]
MKPLITKAIALLAGAWRYRWQGLAVTWLVCLGGWLAVWSIPDRYAVEAKIYIDTDTVLGPLMRGLTVPTDQDQQVAIMLKSMTTRPNLEQIVRLTNPRAPKMKPAEMETAVAELSNNIQMSAQGVKNLFSIGYVDNNSAYAEEVTQSLLSILVDSNVGDKRRDIQGARTFIDQKIAEYEVQLREAETRRANFKAQNLDVLTSPGGPGSIDAANAELQTAKNDLAAAQVTVSSLHSQLQGMPQTIASDQLPIVSDKGTLGGGSVAPITRLREAEQSLADMRSQYTDAYPGVVEAKRLIAELQKQVLEAQNPKAPAANAVGVPNPVYVDMRTKLSAGEVQVAILQHKVASASERLEKARKNTTEAIAINNKYADLDRDYNVLLANYEELVKGREAARMSQSMSDQQQSISFRIIEPPKRTEFPVSPPRRILNSMVLLAGLAAGGALALLLSLLAGRFTTSDELASYFSLPLLGVVTAGANAAAARKERLSVALVASGFLSLVAIYGTVMLVLTTSIYTKFGIGIGI